MNRPAFKQGASGSGASFRLDRKVFDVVHEFGGEAVRLRTIEHIALLPRNGGLVGLAKVGGRLDKGLQHGLQVECRAADDLEHVGRGDLLLQRFAQLLRPLLYFREQPHVLDGDGGLVGEGFQPEQSAYR